MTLESVSLVLDAIRSASVEPASVFTIADYGCANGSVSMPLVYACVKELRQIHGDNLPIQVIYEDQPVNDFKSLFLHLQGKAFSIVIILSISLGFFVVSESQGKGARAQSGDYVIYSSQPPSWIQHFLISLKHQKTVQINSKIIKTNTEVPKWC